MEQEIWTTRVESLMSIFRDYLLALIPHLEAARIPWHEDDAYDEWDNISEALFENIVLRSIRWGMADVGKDVIFPRYGRVYGDYGEQSLIEVYDSEPSEFPRWVFLRLSSEQNRLDSVKCLPLAQDGKVLTAGARSVPFAKAFYRVWLRDDGRLKERNSKLAIRL